MSHLRTFTILAILLSLINHYSFAQESDPFSYAARIQPSAEAWQMARHGEIAPDLFTGAMAWSLPLYTYKDEDFTIPISLDYRFDGCRPSQPAGVVGMGWNLNCGGVITRQVVGLPDDYFRWITYYDSSEDLHESIECGFYFMAVEHDPVYCPHLEDSLTPPALLNLDHCTAQPTPILQDITNNALTAILGTAPLISVNKIFYNINIVGGDGSPSVDGGPYFDPSSDIYHFSLPAVSGDFVILSDGRIKVFNCSDPEGEVEVSIHFSPLTNTTLFNSRITITHRGTKYLFGGDSDYLEYNYEASLAGQNDPYSATRLCFTALYLSKITAPNGRKAVFCRNASVPLHSMRWRPAVQYFISEIPGQPERTWPGVSNTLSRPIQALVIDSDTLVRFHYEDKLYSEFGWNSFHALNKREYRHLSPLYQASSQPDSTNGYNSANRLSSVGIRNRCGEQIDSISLTQSYTNHYHGSTPKMFLRSMTGKEGNYIFNYEFADEGDIWPPVDTVVTDHWGFWNGRSCFGFDSLHRQRSSLYDLPSTAKDPDSVYSIRGALRRIDYPSGGYSLIDYEPNVAHQCIDLNIDQDDTLRIVSSSGMNAGGMRVAKIINDSGKAGSHRDSVCYDYCNSGILMQMPRYFIDASADFIRFSWTYYESIGKWVYGTDSGHLGLSSFNIDGLSLCGADGHIGYSRVIKRLSDSSHAEYRFSNITEWPDAFLLDLSVDDDFSNEVVEKMMVGEIPQLPSTSCAFQVFEGSPTNIRQANIRLTDLSSLRGKQTSERIYSADSVLVKRTDFIWDADTAACAVGVYNVFSDFITARRHFVQPRLDSVITTEYLPGGGSLSDTTRYTYNDLGQQTVIEKRGFDGDIRRSRFSYEHESDATAPPANVAAVATSRLYVDGNNRSEYLTSLRHFEYETDSALRHLPILSQEFCSKAPRFPVVNDGGIEWFAPKSTDDTLARRLSYNAMQRPALLSLPGGAYVAFTWDASGRYPLSREDNGPAMVSSYQWKDMVGLTRKTDPTLRSEWYGYDDKCRLSEVRRADSVKVTAYDYHLWCEDSTQGPSYTKQTTWRTSGKNNREIVYYDGLGYPIQKVRTSTQTTGGHIVTPIAYDALRRDDAKAYLPYEASQSAYDSNAFTKQKNYYKTRFSQDTIAYTEKEYGTSPAGRLLSSRQPGKAYADSAKRIVYEYRTNTLADSILNLYATVDTLPKLKVGSGYLSSGRLLLTKTTDEDGCTSEVFTNSTGKTILARQRTGGARLDTYYVYDLRDSLVCVLQPEGAARITLGSVHDILRPTGINSADTIPQIGSLLSEYAFLYAYDSHGRLVAKKLPGAAAEEFIPDDRGRTILSRNGNLRTAGKWLYNEYDSYDALLRSSLISANVGLDTLRKAARGQVDIIYPDTTWMWPYYYPQDQEIVFYGRTAILAAGDSLFTPELDYTGNVESAGNDPILGRFIVFEMERYYVGASAVGFPDGETTVVNWPGFFAAAITESTLLEEHRYDRGEAPAVPAALAFSPVTDIVSQGDLGSTRNLELWQRQLLLPPGRTVPGDMLCYVERAFYYDTPGNTVQTVERNALGGISRTSAKYDYLGNVLSSEESHAAGPAATADRIRKTFAYDNQGRVATETASLPGRDTASTLFSYDIFGRLTNCGYQGEEDLYGLWEDLSYDIRGRLLSKEAFRIAPLGNPSGGIPGGEEDEEPEEPEEDETQLVFSQYLRYHSPLKAASQRRWNGLISEIDHQRTDTGTVITNGYFYDHAGRLTDHIRYDGSSQTNKYTERDLSFDRNGNILSLKRFGTNVAAPQDNLAYTYDGNKLMQLNGSTYQYDANGNMTHDGRRGLDLSWNHLNLPSSICSDEDEDALVNYTYLTDGTKVITQQPAAGEGYAYLGSATYKRSGNSWVLESVPFTGGRFIANATGGMDEYRYITDHLGSTRVIVTGTDYHEVEHNDYYPFGMRIADNSLPTVATNRWRFSGKEMQTLGDINLIDFGARLYDDFSGRWITRDPLAEDYSSLTPYSYCFGNPICLIDPFGKDIWEINSEGRVVKRITDKTEDVFYLVDDNGERLWNYDEEGNKSYVSIHFEYKTIESQKSISFATERGVVDTYDVYRVRGDENGKALFEFFADHLTQSDKKIEFGLAMTGIEGAKGLDFVTTSHSSKREYGQSYLFRDQLLKGYTIRELRHSHPTSYFASEGDMSFKRWVIQSMQRSGYSRKTPFFVVYSALYHTSLTFTIND